MRLWLVRHGQSTWNAEKKAQGWADPPLSDLGLRQAAAVGRYFAGKSLDALYSSSLMRARQTARAIAEVTGLALVADDRLKERGLGEATGMPWGEWESVVHPVDEARAAMERGESIWPYIKGAEPEARFQARISAAIQEIIEQHPDQDVVVVSHGGVLSVYLRMISPDVSDDGYSFNNAAVSMVEFNGNKQPTIHLFNDSQHLQNLEVGVV